MPMVSLMAPLNSLAQDYQNEEQHDFFIMQHQWNQCWYHIMPLALATHDNDGIINGTIAFLRSR